MQPKLYFFVFLLFPAKLLLAGTTYTWNAGTGNFNLATNWTPNRNLPLTDDILVFNITCTVNLNTVLGTTVAQIKIENNAAVTWAITNTTAVTMTVGSATSGGDYFTIEAGSILNFNEGSGVNQYGTISIVSGNRAVIRGSLVLKGGTSGSSTVNANKILSSSASSIIVTDGGSIEVANGLRGYPFYNETERTDNVVYFRLGATYLHNSANALNPFGENSSTRIVTKTVFQTGSLFLIKSTKAIDIYRRTYADIDVAESNSVPLGIQNISDGIFTFNNLTIRDGKTFTVSRYDDNSQHRIYIKGSITGVGTGALSFETGNGGNIAFNGGITQTVSGGTGEFLFNPGSNNNGALIVDNSSTLKLERSVTLQSGKNWTVRANCTLDAGDAILLSKGGKANIKGNEGTPGILRTSNPNGLYGGTSTSFPSAYWNSPTFNGFSSLEYYRLGDQLVSTGFEYPDLILSGSGIKTITGDFSKSKNMTINTGIIFDNLAYSITNNGGNFDIYGTFRTKNLNGFVGGGNGSPAIINFPAIYLRSGSVVEYSATSGEQLVSPLEVKDGLCYQTLKMTGGSLKKLYPTNENITCLVKENLTLENGIITFQNKNGYPSLTLDTGAIVTGGSDISFVDSFMYRKTAKIADFPFPVGKRRGTAPYVKYRPFTVTTTETTATTFSGEYFPDTHAQISQPSTGSIVSIFNREYWQANRVSGTGKAKVTLNYINPNANTSWTANVDPSVKNCYVVVVKSTGSVWQYSTTTPSSFTSDETRVWNNNGSISTKEISSFSPFTFGLLYPAILPVKLLSFTGTLKENSASLNWQLANSNEVADIGLQYSNDGIQFNKIAVFNAVNNAAGKYIDKKIKPGVNYYRLLIINKNGERNYSNLVTVIYKIKQTIIIGLEHNMINQDAIINIFSTKMQAASARLIDLNGEVIMRYQYILQNGANNWRINNLALLRNGQYYLQVVTEDGSKKTMAILKQ